MTKLNADVYTDRHKGLVPDKGAPYLYRFADDPPNAPANASWRANIKVNGFEVRDQKQGVRDAFQTWSDVSIKEGLGYLFQEAGAGQEADITIRKAATSGEGVAGAFQSLPLLPNRRITGGVITLSIDESYLLTQKGYFKVTLHEIGHALGLAHPWAPAAQIPDNFPLSKGKTVMNNFGFNRPQSAGSIQPVLKVDDPGNYVAPLPTVCDVKGVRVAKTR